MAKGFILSEDDRDALKRHMEEFARRYLNTRNHSPDMTIDREETVAPEVYVARTPSTGIAASNLNTTGSGTLGLYDDQPSSAECQMYQLIPSTSGSPTLRPMTDTTKTVYNVSGVAVDGNIWILAVRDKWGDWYAVAPMGQSAEEDADDCRYLTVPTKICLMYRDLPGTGTGTGSAGPTATGAPWFWLRTEYSIIDLKDRCNVVATYCVDNEADCCDGGGGVTPAGPRWAPGQYGTIDPCTGCGTGLTSLTATIVAPHCPCVDGKTALMSGSVLSNMQGGFSFSDCNETSGTGPRIHIFCSGAVQNGGWTFNFDASILSITGVSGGTTEDSTSEAVLRTFICSPFYMEWTFNNTPAGYTNPPSACGYGVSDQVTIIIQE